MKKRQSFQPLLIDTLQALQNPLYSPNSEQFKAVTCLIKNCDFFRNHLPKQIDLNKFAELAMLYVHYEKHDYGSILHYEKEIVEKFFIILEGTAVKLGSKAMSSDLEIKETEHKTVPLTHPKSNPFNNHSPKASGYFFNPSLLSVENHSPNKKSRKLIPSRNSSIDIESRLSQCYPNTRKDTNDSETGKIHHGTSNYGSFLAPPKPSSSIWLDTLDGVDSEGGFIHPRHRRTGSGTIYPSLVKTEEDLLRETVSKKLKAKHGSHIVSKTSSNAAKLHTYETGEYFGEAFCNQPKQRESCMIVASSQFLHVLTLDRESYFKIIKELNAEKLEKAEVFTNLFPLFDIQLIEEFSNFFSKKTFCLDEVIYSQDGPSQNLYLLKTGEVKLLCDFHGGTEPTSPQSGGKKNISVVSVVKNQVFGEEVLLNRPKRQYTAVSNSPNTAVYLMESSAINKIKLKFGQFFGVLKGQAQKRLAWRKKKNLSIFEDQVLSKSPSAILAYTPKANTRKFDFPLPGDLLFSPQNAKPVFHSTSYQHFIEKIPVPPPNKVISMGSMGSIGSMGSMGSMGNITTTPEKPVKEESPKNTQQNDEEKPRKLVNSFSRTYLRPDLDIIHSPHRSSRLRVSFDPSTQFTPFDFNVRKELYTKRKKAKKAETEGPQQDTLKKSSVRPTTAKSQTWANQKEHENAKIKRPNTPIEFYENPKVKVAPNLKEKRPQTAVSNNVNLTRPQTAQMTPRSLVKVMNFNIELPAEFNQEKLDGMSTYRPKSAQKTLSNNIKSPKNNKSKNY